MTIMKKMVTVNPGESKPVAFTFTPQQPRIYEVGIDGLYGSFSAVQAPPVDEVILVSVQSPSTVEGVLPLNEAEVPFTVGLRIHVPYMEPETYSYTVYKVEVSMKGPDPIAQMGKMPCGWWSRIAIGPWAQGAPDTHYVYTQYKEIDDYTIQGSARLSSMEFRTIPYLPYPLAVKLEVEAWDGQGDAELYRGVVLSENIGTLLILS